jgi:hypothetical protein
MLHKEENINGTPKNSASCIQSSKRPEHTYVLTAKPHRSTTFTSMSLAPSGTELTENPTLAEGERVLG